MIRRPFRALVATLAVAGMMTLAACTTPAPAPTPSATGFTDEAEAFAAAEETYRAYVDALNRRREDPTGNPTPEQFLSGNALDSDVDSQRQLDEAGLRITGASSVERVLPSTFELPDQVSIVVCLDSSETRVVDDSGQDKTPADRATVSRLSVDLVRDSDVWLISDSQLIGEDQC
ncbi:hypothetical protein [Microbacterium sp. cx-59]|uniref:hypothetical protein n=1 Tax=Microbacterium sp. cx-59 TaxID=2891207 RepID=UPI001E5668F3|nr:hypothetical protein [Microbacterium sp. cx-59]MCC4907569.1 hypothetical protein [Microbacterium sp. cx-59]